MNPLFARNRISDYLDNELSPTEKSEFEACLEQSPELQAQLNEMRLSLALFKTHGPSEAPPDLMGSIMSRLDDPIQEPMRQRPPAKSTAFIWPSLAVAALCLVFLIPEAPKPPAQINMGSILEVTTPNPIDLPVNMPAAVDLLSPQSAIPTASSTPTPSATPKVTKTDEKSTKPSKMPTVTFIPETPYVPEWESENKHIEIQIENKDFYAIGFASPNVLFALEALAERYSGTLLDTSKNKVEPYHLNNDTNFARVYIQAPLQDWQAIDESLRHLGSDFRHPMIMAGDDQVLFTIEVLFNP